MGPLTALLFYTLTVNHPIDPVREKVITESLVWYATAGKIMDDLTDWLKDTRHGEMNLFTLALEESGELDTVLKATKPLQLLGERAFVPISVFRVLAPQATKRILGVVDFYIDKLVTCNLPRFTSSLKGIRQMMWAYALNEGIPQV